METGTTGERGRDFGSHRVFGSEYVSAPNGIRGVSPTVKVRGVLSMRHKSLVSVTG